MKKSSVVFLSLFIITFFFIRAFTIFAQDATNDSTSTEPEPLNTQQNPDNETQTAPLSVGELNCRYGTAGFNSHMLSWVNTLGAGWYVNFQASTPVNIASEYVHIIRVNQLYSNGQFLNGYTTTPPLTQSGLGVLVDANPGSLWLVGNEPDVGIGQDNILPAMYARAYHDTYHFIKQRDPSAQVAIGGLSMATPGRLQYLDIVWNTYKNLYGTTLPADVWNIHIYILSEYNPGIGPGDGRLALGTNPALAKNWPITGNPAVECPLNNVICRAEHDSVPIFKEQLTAIRQWMKDHGLQNKPLILSEYGSLYPYIPNDGGPGICYLRDELGNCFTPARVNNYMNATINWMKSATDTNLGLEADNYRLVQQWLWFSLYVPEESSGASSNMVYGPSDTEPEAGGKNYLNQPAGSLNALTQIGHNYRNIIQAEPKYVNLHATNAASVIGQTTLPSNTATVTIALNFHNNGNTAVTQPFNISFYADQNRTQLIGTQTINPVINGCARNTYTASVQWSNLSPGVHKYWAVIDPLSAIPESTKNDNVMSGVVLIDPESVFLPNIQR